MQSRTDEHPATTFLRTLYQNCNDGFLNLRFLPSGKNLFIGLEEINSTPDILDIRKDQNTFFGVALRRKGDGTKQGIIEIPTLWVDIDLEGLQEEKKENIRQQYRDFSLKPTLVVNSGGGLHLYWRLKEPLSDKSIPEVEDWLKRLASYFYGDMGSTDASRILRVPGTLNYKYSPPRKVTLKVYNPENEYNLDDFDFLPSLDEIPKTAGIPIPHERWWEELLDGVFEGERNIAITRLTGHYLGKKLSREEILPILLKANSRFKPPLDVKEVERTLDSVIRTHRRDQISPSIEEGETPGSDQNHSGHHFYLIHAKDLVSKEDVQTDWIWEGVLPSGGLSLVVAKPKVGKTTFALNLAVAISRGSIFLERKTNKANVVYLALEERKEELKKKLKYLGVTEEPLSFHFGPAPVQAIREVEPLIMETNTKFLVIDILQKFCRVKDLNDYSQVTRALDHLMAIARRLNCHILLTHHAGKNDRQDGDDILGSTGLLGGVDTSIHIKKRDQKRTFFSIQRYGENLTETVLELKQDGSLEATGSRVDVEIVETMPLILEVLAEPLKENEIWNCVEKGHSFVSKALRRLVDQNKVKRSGSGKRGDPYIYEKNVPYSPPVNMEESREEIETKDNQLELFSNISPNCFQKDSMHEGTIRNDSLSNRQES